MEDPGTQEVLPKSKASLLTNTFNEGSICMRRIIEQAQKCPQSNIKGEGMNKTSLQGALRNIKPPIFDGENKMGEDVEAWLLGIRKYFQLHNYSSNLEAIIAYT
jgi:hypothetical protein